ncbi:MAG: Rpn family recombination-promoting nuclease/putative transposase [Lachnospiraceae bacterium]|nr:Rpn family recombination-promoting nuclease/putative transposase [Lachnospiraceae bacterium]
MGKPDTATREYINDSYVFADVFNYFIYGGRKVVNPQNLEKLDASTLLTVFGKNGDEETIQRYRDALKKAALMVDDEAAYIVLGIEAQTRVDYGMPIRTFLYDALQYDSQARELKAAHKNAGDKHSEAEFVSGLYKEDRILPVITVVVHFGAKPWDGATRLSDLYNCSHKELMAYAPDYKMNLIDPAGMTDEDFEKFSTSLGKVLKFMKLSNSRKEMKKLMETDKAYKSIDRNAARVLRECANISLDLDSNQEVIDVCKAWSDAQNDAAVKAVIKAFRGMNMPDSDIVEKIMEQFQLSKEDAEAYLAKKSA